MYHSVIYVIVQLIAYFSGLYLSGLYLYRRYKRYCLKAEFNCIVESDRLIANLDIPYRIRNKLEEFSAWNIDFFRENYGKRIVSVLESKNKECSKRDACLRKMQLKRYIDKYIRGKRYNKKIFYFKSEDSYRFLSDIGLDRRIENSFKAELPWYIYSAYSFWMGPKGSTTTFHYDIDYANLLCILEGKKRVLFVPPRGEGQIVPLSSGDNWTDFDPEDEMRVKRMKEEGNLYEIIVEKGEILNIPRNVWHAVINLEDTVAFTFHYETLESVIYGGLYKVVSNTI